MTLSTKRSTMKSLESSPLRSRRSSVSTSTSTSTSNRIHVHHADLFTDVVVAGEEVMDMDESPFAPSVGGVSSKTMQEMQREHVLLKRKQKEEQYRKESEKAQRDRMRKVADKVRRREEDADRLLEFLEEEKLNFLSQVDAVIASDERSKQLRREKLYSEWERRVFLPIQEQILNQLDSISVEEIERRRREMFEEFLAQTNCKAGIFRDIILPSEYDPLKARSYSVRYRTNIEDDPVKAPLFRVKKERKNVGAEVPIEPPAGRDTFDVKQWAHVDATPHGHYSHIMEREEANPGRKREPSSVSKSSVVLDHFHPPSSSEINREFPRGKRTYREKT